jgi:hypothetical protein
MKTSSQHLNLLYECIKHIVIVLCLVMIVSGIILAQVSHSVSFMRDDFSYATKVSPNGISYQKISLKNLYPSGEVGSPELPVKHVRLIIPPDQDVANIVISSKQDAEISGTFMIYPIQNPIPTKDGPLPPFANPKSIIYSSDELFPGEIA